VWNSQAVRIIKKTVLTPNDSRRRGEDRFRTYLPVHDGRAPVREGRSLIVNSVSQLLSIQQVP